jgi:hypothetical protein
LASTVHAAGDHGFFGSAAFLVRASPGDDVRGRCGAVDRDAFFSQLAQRLRPNDGRRTGDRSSGAFAFPAMDDAVAGHWPCRRGWLDRRCALRTSAGPVGLRGRPPHRTAGVVAAYGRRPARQASHARQHRSARRRHAASCPRPLARCRDRAGDVPVDARSLRGAAGVRLAFRPAKCIETARAVRHAPGQLTDARYSIHPK